MTAALLKRRSVVMHGGAEFTVYPPSDDGGPIEACRSPLVHTSHKSYPPSDDGGPIEAKTGAALETYFKFYPPSDDGGPIEATPPYF